jgi:hypothetical protein
MVLRNLRMASQESGSAKSSDLAEISLDLQVGKVPVDFRTDPSGNIFGEMHQVDPVFGPVHDRETIAVVPTENGLTDLRLFALLASVRSACAANRQEPLRVPFACRPGKSNLPFPRLQ